MEKVLILVFAAFLLAAPALADTRRDLAALERQAKEKEKQLQQLKKQQDSLAKELNALTQKERAALQQSRKLAGDIEVFKTQSDAASAHRKQAGETLPAWQKAMAKDIEVYIAGLIARPNYFNDSPAQSLMMLSLLQTQAAFAGLLEDDLKNTQAVLQRIDTQSSRLSARQSALEKQRQTLQGSYQKTKQDLDAAKERAAKAERELKDLKESAQKMQSILKEAEAKRQKAAKQAGAAASKAVIGISRNSLPWPVEGKIISKFGREYQAQLKTWIFRDGVKIAAPAGTGVESVKEGKVIFAGDFRSYGNVVIIDHKGGFFTIYGFLSAIRVIEGQDVTAGQVVGLSGIDSQGAAMGSGRGAVYFEIRVGTTAEDPMIWLEPAG
ncbi:MAG: M23 family metallopeptidase [Elusimicrobiota bacterium]|jgi:septal ring factor EnvC (AmiA/AmiB activator)|nr:M23 family metallopeptidase [Elusimicrobiota bacterium]